MTKTTESITVHLNYHPPGRVRRALAVVLFIISEGFKALAIEALTRGRLKVTVP